ncbi:MAG: hypothetical protein EB091_12810 [Betaproteobacteria bacterium]|nr:S8 family peptidase [Pseudomonadota bacterium]NBP62933.1 hypothetical protein [Betaproteobacteria bacterium]NBQ10123.1 hypothetical protein [Betaproteobacteria bacterium]NBU02524.1 hypothetical protein [Betaproteobacteria bacterium]NCV15753.1 hypothetical protein [Betaproteobacteria bacterium]
MAKHDRDLLSAVVIGFVSIFCFLMSYTEAFASIGEGEAPSSPQTTPPANGLALQGARVIVKYKASVSHHDVRTGERARQLGRHLGVSISRGRMLGDRMQGIHASDLSSSELVKRLEKHPDVEWAVVDERKSYRNLPNDPLFPGNQASSKPAVGQWYLRSPDAEAVSAINAQGAWTITTGSRDLTVAVLDTGVIFSHPDLSGKLRPGYDFVSSVLDAIDGSGRDADPSDPGDWTPASFCKRGDASQVSSWHGTKVSSLIGAMTNNGFGMASVGHNVFVNPIRVLGRCGGFDSDIIAGMYWAAGLSSDVGLNDAVFFPNPFPARVMNLSFGSSGACNPAYREAIQRLNLEGVVVVAAAGNDAGLAVGSPANCPGVIAVAGLRHRGTKVGYSNLGPEVTVSAPAGNCVNLTGDCLYPLIAATDTGKTIPLESTFSNSTNATVGTSFSAPLVAGAVALMLSANPSLSVSEITSMLRQTARPFPASGADADVSQCIAPSAAEQLECYCNASTCGAGMLDVAAAVTLASQRLMQSKPTANVEPSPSTGNTSVSPTADRGGGGIESALLTSVLLIVSILVVVARLIRLQRRSR